MSEYPEHDKLVAINDKSQAIHDFIEWLGQVYRIVLAEPEPGTEGRYFHTYRRQDKLLAEFFNIDLAVIEKEKRAMLDVLRAANEREEVSSSIQQR